MLIYLDACCLNRPFDDPRIERNHLEAEAVFLILRRIERGEWRLCGSAALVLEIDLCPAPMRREAVRDIVAASSVWMPSNHAVLGRMDELIALGFKEMDALHLASAEAAQCDVLLTTDDRFLRRCAALNEALRVLVANPLTWILEQMNHGQDR